MPLYCSRTKKKQILIEGNLFHHADSQTFHHLNSNLILILALRAIGQLFWAPMTLLAEFAGG
jgi:hypothetical protein